MFYLPATAALFAKSNMNIANTVFDLQCDWVCLCVCLSVYVCLCACVCVCSVLRSVLFPFIYVILDTGRVAAARDIEMSLYYTPSSSCSLSSLCHPLCVLCFGCLKKWWDCGNFLCHSVISIFKYSPSFVYAARKLFEAYFLFKDILKRLLDCIQMVICLMGLVVVLNQDVN